MPISLTFTEGTLSPTDAQEAGRQITALFLRTHDLTGNPVMGPGVTCHINFLPRGQSLSNGEPFSGAWIETRTPSFALASPEQQQAFFGGSIDVVQELSRGRLQRTDIHGSAVHTVDGTWILRGQPLTNADLIAAVS